jgi:microcystin-dependent protein
MDPYIGEIKMTAFNYAPQGWVLCQGQTLYIDDNTDLFQLLGTAFGGDGVNTFCLPNLQGRIPVGMGLGNGLSPRKMGQTGGEEAVELTVNQLPAHDHSVIPLGSNGEATEADPTNAVPANTGSPMYGPEANVKMQVYPTSFVGENAAHDNMQPYLVVNYIIAFQGIYPPKP